MVTERACPHSGAKIISYPSDHGEYWVQEPISCHEGGWLCDMCKQDRADARTQRLVEGLSLAGLLANPNVIEGLQAHQRLDRSTAIVALSTVDALRSERAGGDG